MVFLNSFVNDLSWSFRSSLVSLDAAANHSDRSASFTDAFAILVLNIPFMNLNMIFGRGKVIKRLLLLSGYEAI